MARCSVPVSEDDIKICQQELLQYVWRFRFHHLCKRAAVGRVYGVKGNGKPLGWEKRHEWDLADAGAKWFSNAGKTLHHRLERIRIFSGRPELLGIQHSGERILWVWTS